LHDAEHNPLGLISVDAPRNGLRPDLPTIESLEIFASQAALTIESHQRLQELDTQASALEAELRRSQAAMHDSQHHLPVLLHKDIEQMIAIQSLGERARRIRAGLDIAEIVNHQSNRQDVMIALGREILTRMNLSLVLLAEASPGGPRLIDVIGVSPTGLNLEALLGQRNPLRQALQNGEAILVSNVEENSEWKGSPLLHSLEAKAFICLPVVVDSKVDFSLLGVSEVPLPPMIKEDEHLYDLICRQVAIALMNLQLLNETNRRLQEVNLLLEFSRQLGTLDPVSILRTLVESSLQVVPAAHAGMVALWDAEKELLIPQAASGYINNNRILEIPYRSGQALPGQVFERGEALRVDEVNFAQHYNLSSEYLLLYRDATEGRLPVSSLILPIQTVENKLGVLVLDNFKASAVFTAEDQALVGSLTRQTALTLENARLYQAAEQRAVQLLALTNVAATITSSLQTDDLINSLLGQVSAILPYDTGTLWLRQGRALTIRAANGFEDSEQRIGLSVAVEDSSLLREMIETSRPISVGDVRQDERFPSLIEQKYLSWLGVPLLSKGEVVGVLAFEKAEAHFYTPDHIASMITFAGQAAVALVNARLYEESVSRAVELAERSQRLALLNRLSSELSGSLDLDYLLNVAIHELEQAINCSRVSAVSFDSNGKALLNSESPEMASGYPQILPASPLYDRIRESLGVFSTESVEQEEILTSLREFFSERETRSVLCLPLATGNTLHGLLIIHSNYSYRYAGDEVELARTISNQVAVAIQNARLFTETERLFAETQQRSSELATLFDLGVNITQVLDQQKLIETTFENTLRLMGADSVGLVMVGEEETMLIRALDRGEWVGPTAVPRRGISFSEYVLDTGAPLFIKDMDQERDSLPVRGYTVGEPVKCWLGIPLVVRGTTVGVLSVQSYHPHAFGDVQFRLLGQVGNQLAVALDNARLFETVQNYASELEKRVLERTRELENEHGRTQTLLDIITELSASLDLDLVLSRTLVVINEAIGSEHSLIMLLRPDDASLYLRASIGYVPPPPKGGQTTTIRYNESLAGWVMENRQATLIPDLTQDPRWFRRSGQQNQHRSAMAVPLMMGEENLGVLLLYHRQPDFFTLNQLELVQATAKQIAVAINNAQLFNLIRDQAERLGDMLRTQHVETSRSQAILEAVADGVLVTDANRVITLFNISAENILGLDREKVMGRSLENFIGLFGKAGQPWVQTIRTWSEDPSTYKPGDTYAEQIELDDRRVVSVHLSPVLLRNDFLGKVSIFRDITHMIELDRLKSEFVATVSHELRTPMTSIKGYVEILLMGAAGVLSDQQMHFLQVVRTNTERLAILVNDLLDISRIEAGRVTLSMQPLDMYEIVRQSVATITQRVQDENRPMQIEADLQPDLPSAFGDQERVRQILDNLMENAYQYTPESGSILVRVYPVKGEIQVDVKDNGIGIMVEDQPRIFERFFRGEDPLVLATSGTGLGLSIVKHLVEMHNGHIWFESSGIPGQGSTFSFTIPIFEDARDQIGLGEK
jgi:PAS domain S-box-containing protein